MQETWSDPRVGKILWRREWLPTPVNIHHSKTSFFNKSELGLHQNHSLKDFQGHPDSWWAQVCLCALPHPLESKKAQWKEERGPARLLPSYPVHELHRKLTMVGPCFPSFAHDLAYWPPQKVLWYILREPEPKTVQLISRPASSVAGLTFLYTAELGPANQFLKICFWDIYIAKLISKEWFTLNQLEVRVVSSVSRGRMCNWGRVHMASKIQVM